MALIRIFTTTGFASILFLVASTLTSRADPHIEFKAFGDKQLCRALIIDESRVKEEDEHYSRDLVSNARNALMPWGGEVVSLRNVENDLEKDSHKIEWPSDQFHNAFVEISEFDFSNSGKTQTVYHIYGSSHYFDGDIYLVTDAKVPEEKVAQVIDKLANSSGSLEDTYRVARERGWRAFSGGEMFYQSARYTTLVPFRYNGKTYLVATGIRPGPIAIVYEPRPNGRLTDACLFYRNKSCERYWGAIEFFSAQKDT